MWGMWDFGGFRQEDALLDVHEVVPRSIPGYVWAYLGAAAMSHKCQVSATVNM